MPTEHADATAATFDRLAELADEHDRGEHETPTCRYAHQDDGATCASGDQAIWRVHYKRDEPEGDTFLCTVHVERGRRYLTGATITPWAPMRLWASCPDCYQEHRHV